MLHTSDVARRALSKHLGSPMPDGVGPGVCGLETGLGRIVVARLFTGFQHNAEQEANKAKVSSCPNTGLASSQGWQWHAFRRVVTWTPRHLPLRCWLLERVTGKPHFAPCAGRSTRVQIRCGPEYYRRESNSIRWPSCAWHAYFPLANGGV